MTRLTPRLAAPPTHPTAVTHWAAPSQHANDAPCHHRPRHPAAPTPGRELTCRALRATAACTRPGQGHPRQRHPTGQRQRPQPPAEPPRSQPSATTAPHVAPCSDRSLPANPPGTATTQHAKTRPEEATQAGSRWTPAQRPTGTSCAQRHQAHARSRRDRLTRRNCLSCQLCPETPAEAKPRPTNTNHAPRALTFRA